MAFLGNIHRSVIKDGGIPGSMYASVIKDGGIPGYYEWVCDQGWWSSRVPYIGV